MKRLLLALLLVACAYAYADPQFAKDYGTANGTTHEWTIGFNASCVWLKNDDTTNILYYRLDTTDATTSSYQLLAQEGRTWCWDYAKGGNGFSAVNVITGGSSVAYRMEAEE